VRAFLTRAEESMRKHALWRDDSAAEWDATNEELERFVMGKLHAVTFAAHPACARRDARLAARLQALSFVGPRHLDLAEPSELLAPGWRLAQAALRDVDGARAPADKLTCIMNACRIIALLLQMAAEERGRGDRGVGADDFLPALIYTVIRAQPKRLYSSLRFIGEFRSPSKLMSEEGYFYTNLLSAVAFAKRARADQLSMSAAEFDAAAAEARSRAEARRAREVRRGVGSTAAARRIGGFSPGSGPGGGGDFDADADADGEGEGEGEGEGNVLVASMSVSSWALSFAGLSAREAAAAAALGRRAGGSFSDNEEVAEEEEEEEEKAPAAALAPTVATGEAAPGADAAAPAAAAVATGGSASCANRFERALDVVRDVPPIAASGVAEQSGELAPLVELLRALDAALAELAR